MKFILQYPDATGPEGHMLAVGSVGEVAAHAEAAGFHGFALTEHPSPGANWLQSGGHQTLDPLIGLSFAAAATTELRLVTYLSVLPYRNPLLFAKAVASLDLLSNGRVNLGVGTGYLKSEFFALGVDFGERNALFDETLEVVSTAWSGQPFSYKGRHFDARDIVQLPKPAQTEIPIWIGGNSRLSRRRAAERGHGWMPLLHKPEVTRTSRTPHIESTRELAGLISEVKDLAVGRRVPLDFVGVYNYPRLQQGDVLGDREQQRRIFDSYEEAGITWLVLQLEASTPERLATFITDFSGAFLQ